MVAVNATSRAMTTRQMERVFDLDEELSEVPHCWKTRNCKLLRDEIMAIGRLALRGARIIVPVSLRDRVLELTHEGHQGIVETKECLQSKVWWPNRNGMVDRH